ncbi:hypothetical protein BVY01_03455 [bacterium I07]|nr:hypothetical protein BVY01_03455 [bacterium I07]
MINKVISHFKILEKLGEGGMGVVYKAHDTKLNRTVALKFLPASLTANETDKARFLQEAQAAAALNHNNVCTIHEIREHEDQQFIVMEYVEGMTLNEKIKSGPLELKTVIDYAMQIGEGLKAAHAKGIVHRDIKSSNIMVTGSNQIKVMDFGLAKLRGSTKLTKTTSTIGTLAYMSPEHLQNKDIDARTDIFSFGVVLYEMLTGELPFKGDYDSALMYSIVNVNPEPVSKFRSDVSSELMHIMNRVLEKDPEDRYLSVKDMLVDLKRVKRDSDRVVKRVVSPVPDEEVIEQLSPEIPALKRSRRWLLPTGIVSTLILIVLAIVLFKPFSKEPNLPMKVIPFTSLPGLEWEPTFSPDGTQIAFCWSREGNYNNDIYVKTIGLTEPQRRTNNAGMDFSPRWSPDGRHIAFIRQSEDETGICIIPAIGGAERKLPVRLKWTQGSSPWIQISWSQNSKSVIFPNRATSEEPFILVSINVETFEKDTLTYPPDDIVGDIVSAVSPDGKRMAFVRTATNNPSRDIYIKVLPNGVSKPLTHDNAQIFGLTWTQDGKEIVFGSNSGGNRNLWRISAKGGVPELLSDIGQGGIYPTIAPQGQYLAYEYGITDMNIYQIQISKLKTQTVTPSLLISSTHLDQSGVFSPSGEDIAFQSRRSGNFEIWICDKNGKNWRQLTSLGGPIHGSPFWSPSGKEIVFDCVVDGNKDIFVVNIEGGKARRITTEVSDDAIPRWSRDGKWIYFRSDRSGKRQIWKIPRAGGKAVQVTQNGGFAAFESSDGKWLYYSKPEEDRIWKMPVQGGEDIVVIDHSVHHRNWVLKCDAIYYINDTDFGFNMEFFDLTTGEVTKIAEIREQIGIYLDVSPDGSRIIYSQQDSD